MSPLSLDANTSEQTLSADERRAELTTHIAIVQPDGTVIVPVDEARPGETVLIRIDRATDHPTPGPLDDENLTIRTADTPEKSERFRQQIHEWGQRNRAGMSREQLDCDWDARVYDETDIGIA